MDEYVEELLKQEFYFDVSLPRLPKRQLLEEEEGFPPRTSQLEQELIKEL